MLSDSGYYMILLEIQLFLIIGADDFKNSLTLTQQSKASLRVTAVRNYNRKLMKCGGMVKR